jgi:hypothetical protein
MLSIEEFKVRFILRLREVLDLKPSQWMKDCAESAYEMWLEDDPDATTPEDMADSECDEMRRDC